jgi:glyceraldehyde 3-phosphate dehydrogenase
VELDGSTLVMGDHRVPIVQAREPGDVDWSEFGVTTVVQATGKYRTREYCERHLAAGAHRVILASTPETPSDLPILLAGVNDEILMDDTTVIAMGSNTSNAFAPLLEILNEAYGVNRVFFTTVHAYTNKERLGDVPTDDFRSSRAAGENIIPSKTNSPEILSHVLPQFAGKLSGMALNVPVENGSTVDSVAKLGTPVTKTSVNELVRAEAEGRFAGILGYTDDPIVSSDVRGTTYSGIFDSQTTIVVDGTMLKTIVWFDNGWGYSVRVVETLRRIAAMEVSA